MARPAPNLARSASSLSSPARSAVPCSREREREGDVYVPQVSIDPSPDHRGIVTGVLAPTASAWPGRNGAIVFETDIPGGEEEASRGTGLQIAALGADRDEIGALTKTPATANRRSRPTGAWSSSLASRILKNFPATSRRRST